MKTMNWIFGILFCIILFGSISQAQITNLKMYGFSSNFTAVEGQGTLWEYNLPVGGTATIEIWLDINSNGTIEPAIDKSVFGTFTQTDGDNIGNNGPPDMDGQVNGHCLLNMPHFNFAPGTYVLKFTNNNSSATISGTLTPLPAPLYTVKGTITVPAGHSAQNILIQAEAEDLGWMALTNASGNFTMNFDASATAATFRFSVREDMPPYILTPDKLFLTMNQSYTNVNFAYIAPAAKVVGYLRGEDSHIFANTKIDCWPNQGGHWRETVTDASGFFQIGFSTGDLTNSTQWQIACTSDIQPVYLPPQARISIHLFDSLRVDLKAYLVNDSITGRVTLDGNPPVVSYELCASNQDSGRAMANTVPLTGKFSFPVSRKIYNYDIGTSNTPDNIALISGDLLAHPGMSNILLQFATVAWKWQNTNTGNTLNTLSFINQSQGWAAGMNGTILRTTDGGANWIELTTTMTTADLNGIHFANSTTGWIVGSNGVIKKTTDGGINWTAQNSATSNDLKAVQFLDANTGWIIGSSAVILKTTNGGTNWVAQNAGGPYMLNSISMVDANNGWIVGENCVLWTTNGGTVWNTQISGGQLKAVKFINASTGWMIGNSNWVYRTTDGGMNWSNQMLNAYLTGISAVNASTVWVCGNWGEIYRSTNGGINWVKQYISQNHYADLQAIQFVNANYGWAVGTNGVVLATSTGGAVSVREANDGTLPKSIELSQNYPNPFNPTTTINYQLVENSFVSLKVYDILGNEAAVLDQQFRRAGKYIVEFNANQFNLTSGVYFYRLEAGTYSVTKKFILLK